MAPRAARERSSSSRDPSSWAPASPCRATSRGDRFRRWPPRGGCPRVAGGAGFRRPDCSPRHVDMPHCEFARPPSMGALEHVLVFTFPGQGSQRAGMGEPWVDHPSWEVVEEASAAADTDLTYLLLEAPIEELTQTENAQLATTVLSLVVLDAVERIRLTPAASAGHSLGEYPALLA